jgi:hypothetical protein
MSISLWLVVVLLQLLGFDSLAEAQLLESEKPYFFAENDGVWTKDVRERPWHPTIKNELVLSYHPQWQETVKHESSSNAEHFYEWRPLNGSYVQPIVDPLGFCLSLNHLRVQSGKEFGGVLIIGDELASLASITLASYLKVKHTEGGCSGAKTCTHSICTKDMNLKLTFMHYDQFLVDSCIHDAISNKVNSNCKVAPFLKFLENFNVVMFGLGSSSILHPDFNLRQDAEVIATWFKETYSEHIAKLSTHSAAAQPHGLAATHLVVHYSPLPDYYCSAAEAQRFGIRKIRTLNSYMRIVGEDDNLWELFEGKGTDSGNGTDAMVDKDSATGSGGASANKFVVFRRADISTIASAREELKKTASTSSTPQQQGQQKHCEILSLPSDSTLLLLNTLYGHLLDVATPAEFPVTTPKGYSAHPESHDVALQRVALRELAVLNYINALRKVDSAVAAGWSTSMGLRPSSSSSSASSASSSSGGGSSAAVTLTLSDIRYSEAFAYWYQSKRDYGVEGVMIAMDMETCNYVSEHFHHFLFLCMYTPMTFHCAPPHKQSTLVGIGKVIYPALFLHRYNMQVIFSEMDVFWKGNPLPYLDQVFLCSPFPVFYCMYMLLIFIFYFVFKSAFLIVYSRVEKTTTFKSPHMCFTTRRKSSQRCQRSSILGFSTRGLLRAQNCCLWTCCISWCCLPLPTWTV